MYGFFGFVGRERIVRGLLVLQMFSVLLSTSWTNFSSYKNNIDCICHVSVQYARWSSRERLKQSQRLKIGTKKKNSEIQVHPLAQK